MEKLKFPFVEFGFNHELLERKGKICLVKRSLKDNSGTWHYEVVRLLDLPPRTMPSGLSYPEREGYPPSSTWGQHGFTYGRFDQRRALVKFAELVKKEEAYAAEAGLLAKNDLAQHP
jgi:hypothetical protein